MKKKISTKTAGLILLAIIIAAAGIYSLILSGKQEVISINGYLGGEKIGFMEDEEVQEILRSRYGLEVDYARAGSLDMVTADQTGMDYLFPSSQTALSYYTDYYGTAPSNEIILNTPIVLYTHRMVLDAWMKEGIVSEQDGVFSADMAKLTELIQAGTQWSDMGLNQLYGTVSIDTTDPARSNSGNMFAALLANVLAGETVVDEQSVEEILPQLKEIFSRLGYMESSSSDLFSQFLKMGVGAKPVIAGYESQLLEFAVENPEEYEQIRDDIVMIYPSPTVWSTHIYIALDEAGERGMEALLDEEIQNLAWKKHGFRTSIYGIGIDMETFGVDGIAREITRVMQVPEYGAMKKIIDALSR